MHVPDRVACSPSVPSLLLCLTAARQICSIRMPEPHSHGLFSICAVKCCAQVIERVCTWQHCCCPRLQRHEAHAQEHLNRPLTAITQADIISVRDHLARLPARGYQALRTRSASLPVHTNIKAHIFLEQSA
jgi:hypothetical protein